MVESGTGSPSHGESISNDAAFQTLRFRRCVYNVAFPTLRFRRCVYNVAFPTLRFKNKTRREDVKYIRYVYQHLGAFYLRPIINNQTLLKRMISKQKQGIGMGAVVGHQ